jgi:hypothetical protein
MANSITGTWEEFLKPIQIVSSMQTAYQQLNPEILADLFAEMESIETLVKHIFMNAKVFTVIRHYGRNWYDSETSAEKIKQGIVGVIWGADITVSKSVPDNTVLVTSENNSKGSILQLDADITEAKELIVMHERLQEIASDLQSLMSRASKLVRSMVTKVEKLN